MATIVSQTASSSLAESPIIVDTLATTLLTSSSLKMVCDLYVWEGSASAQPATPSYILKKFPITQGGSKKAVFDLSPILNSYTSSSLAELKTTPQYTTIQSGSNTKWFTYEIYEEAKNASNQTITGSHSSPSYEPFIASAGYLKWGEKKILGGDEAISNFCPDFPLLTSAPVSQSISLTDVPFYYTAYARSERGIDIPDNAYIYTPSYSSTVSLVDGQLNSNNIVQVLRIPTSTLGTYASLGQPWIKIVLRNGTTAVSGVKHIDLNCQKKYTPKKIIWKNRFGGIDQFEFNLVSTTSIALDNKTYQENALNMATGYYDTTKGIKAYNSQAYEAISVNTDYVTEDYNEFFKEMIVSEELYLVVPEQTNYDSSAFNATWIPVTLESKNVTFKTNEVEKLIQYTFAFKYATPFKLQL